MLPFLAVSTSNLYVRMRARVPVIGLALSRPLTFWRLLRGRGGLDIEGLVFTSPQHVPLAFLEQHRQGRSDDNSPCLDV
jgi:hypothetical protein